METILVGIGGFAVSDKPGAIIKTMALGSCVGIMAVDMVQRVVGMVHVALPESSIDKEKSLTMPGYFADTGVEAMLNELHRHGVKGKGNLVLKIAGGASIMDPNNTFNIGKRNILSIKKYLWQKRLGPRAEDVGGSYSRTVRVEHDTGKIFISSPGRGQWEL